MRAAPAVVPGRISAQDLVRLLERIPAGLRKWTWEIQPRTTNGIARQWHVDNEYHVQNLLWAVLAPIFLRIWMMSNILRKSAIRIPALTFIFLR